jgi:RNA polymerase sigma factor (TIGR02999 family)
VTTRGTPVSGKDVLQFAGGLCKAPPVPGAVGEAGKRADDLFRLVYAQLKSMARRKLSGSRDDTINTTALVHELYLRLHTGRQLDFAEPAQFFVYAGRAMRHILIDRARRRISLKLGAGAGMAQYGDVSPDQLAISPQHALQLDAALNALEAADPRAARVVELHYFVGLPLERVAEILGVVRRTIDRDRRYARSFLIAQVD